MILTAGIVLTLFLTYMVRQWERAIVYSHFELSAQSITAELQRQIDASLEVIHSVAGLYATDRNVTRDEFRLFVQEPLLQHHEIRAIEWLPRVNKADRHKFEQEARRDGFNHFNFTEIATDGALQPAGERAVYFPSYYVEPYNGNEAELGYDHASDPKRIKALSQALQAGSMVSSEMMELVQEKYGSSGFLVLVPVYDKIKNVVLDGRTSKHIKGFILGVYVIRDIVHNIFWSANVSEVNFWIFDNSSHIKNNFLFLFPDYQENKYATKKSIAQDAGFYIENKLNLPGRSWSIVFTPSSFFLNYHKMWGAWFVFISGLGLSALLSIYLFSRTKRENKIEYLANRLASSNNQLAKQIQKRRRTEVHMIKLSSALEQTADAVLITDFKGFIEYVNPAFETITGYRQNEIVGKKPNILKSGRHNDAVYATLWKTLLKGEVYQNILVNKKKNGDLYYEEKTITPLKDNLGNIASFISTGKDITDRMRAQERLHFLAYHDVLTELPNRALFLERINHAITQRRNENAKLAVLFIDLDRFKHINDTLGHSFGDLLLKSLAQRISQHIRKSDTLARFGGDEFAILIENVKKIADINAFIAKLIKSVADPFIIKDHELFITLSIGVSSFPEDGLDADSLLKNADTAMYRAKEHARTSFQYYSSEMNARAKERLHMQTRLHHALDNHQFLIHYQPQYNVQTQSLVGIEALLRWNHPERGLIYPVHFINLLEETGLIIPVGKWVLRTACEQASRWRRQYQRDFRMSINLSPRQLSESDLAMYITNLLDELHLPSECLELEITENVLMADDPNVIRNLNTLRANEVRLAIDDFGTGYASLNYLKRIPISTLKIDRSFVQDLPNRSGDSAIVSAIINLANSLSLDVVAEGVESLEQKDFLFDLDCHVMQGNLYGKPIACSQSAELFEFNNPENGRALVRLDTQDA